MLNRLYRHTQKCMPYTFVFDPPPISACPIEGYMLVQASAKADSPPYTVQSVGECDVVKDCWNRIRPCRFTANFTRFVKRLAERTRIGRAIAAAAAAACAFGQGRLNGCKAA